MPRRDDLPDHLRATPFDVTAGIASGLSPDRLRSSDLQKPFHGVRSVDVDLASVVGRCRAYSARMPESAAFSHLTAAALWGFPLPLWVSTEAVHVATPIGTRARRGKKVVGHQSRLEGNVRQLGGLRVTSPALTWCQLAESLNVPDLIAAAEFAVTGNAYARQLPIATVDELAALSTVLEGGHGTRRRAEALAFAREGALSRPESLLRYLLVTSGLPDPRINENCNDRRGSFIALADLSWPEYRVAVEYEGDYHRDVAQFRRDIRRFEKLADHEWAAIRVSADDLFDRPQEQVIRVASRLAAKGWPGRARPTSLTFAR